VAIIFCNAERLMPVSSCRYACVDWSSKTSTDKSEAICSGTIQHYDKRNKQLFEVKTAPMRTEEADLEEDVLFNDKGERNN